MVVTRVQPFLYHADNDSFLWGGVGESSGVRVIPSGVELLPTGKNYGGTIFCNRYSHHYRKLFLN
eukprot:6230068-Amphidinium_carterae.1